MHVLLKLIIAVFAIAFGYNAVVDTIFILEYSGSNTFPISTWLYPIFSSLVCVSLIIFLTSQHKLILYCSFIFYFAYSVLKTGQTYYSPLISPDEYKVAAIIFSAGFLVLFFSAKKLNET